MGAAGEGRVSVPVMMVGGLRSLDLMEEVVAAEEADFVSLCRPLIREPDLVASWQAGQIRRPTCFPVTVLAAHHKGRPVGCVVHSPEHANRHGEVTREEQIEMQEHHE